MPHSPFFILIIFLFSFLILSIIAGYQAQTCYHYHCIDDDARMIDNIAKIIVLVIIAFTILVVRNVYIQNFKRENVVS